MRNKSDLNSNKRALCEFYDPPKRIYVDRLDVSIELAMLQLRSSNPPRRYYYHHFCNGWHLTSQEYEKEGN